MPDIFLSYAREDQVTARWFAEGLQRAGFSVWWDQSLSPGEAFDQVTEKALEEAKAVVVLWSKASVSSRWVRAEATQANADNRLVPVMIESCKRPIMFELTHTADLAGWKGNADDPDWQSFATGLRRFTGKDATGVFPPAAVAMSAAIPPPGGGYLILVRAIAIGLAAALLLGGSWWALSRRGAAPAASAAAVSAPIRLGVLPFKNLKSDPDQAYLSDGLAEDLAIQLNQIKALRALGPASTRRFKADEDPRAIAATLDVAEVLTGTFRRNERQWLFTVNLIDGRDGTARWSERYEGDDVFALQEKIIKDVALAVGVVLGVSDYPRVQGGTESVKAYEQFMRARDVWRTARPVKEQLPFLREAVRLDSDYKRAWLALYNTLRNDVPFASGDALYGLRQERETAAAQLEKMPRDALLALRFRAAQMLDQHRWEDALSAAEAAVAAAPANEFDSNYALQIVLKCLGRFDEAIPYLRRSVDAEPLHAQVISSMQLALRTAGRDAEAEREVAHAEALGVKLGVPPRSWQEMGKNWPRRSDGMLGGWLWGERPEILDDAKAAREALHLHFEGAAGRGVRGGQMLDLARAATVLGDGDLAIAALRNALADTPEATLDVFLALWTLDLPRNSEAFRSFVRDSGLVAYWRKSGKWSDFCKGDKSAKDGFTCH